MPKTDLIKSCMKVEKSAVVVYKKLMKKFPEQKDFWKGLIDDEVDHISFLKDVKSLGLAADMEKIDPLPAMEDINEAIRIAGDLNTRLTADSVSLKKALAMVLKLEETMVEAYTNKLIANLITCEDESSYKRIVSDEKKHRNKIKKMMKQ